ncbi:MAG: sigma-70 family RNA polymerase sigma factor [Alphaproteobacteria bacterium]|jgi:RNA polymerase sigma-70 factor (ECF subfamily)|nr:sigma-70 family RNA polymerase sigma factor [Alphaproteobacteria bacterium]MCB1551623.1 sigma-70 family RNA polymerase sigma factor [Alphaproteobacteria bacterium]MCB9984107.1 sigma-70 family RNA polymerase sigma factor [Micavibrio sp.]HRK96956.1 sigma-70 family RNA polymerase sigma factor [Alphaproteobacteria bacterium]
MVIQTVPLTPTGFSRYEEATDEQLLHLIALGDDRALDCVMRRYRGLIYRVVKSYMGSLTDAEDMFQDIYLFLYQNREAYKIGSAKFSSWLYRVVVNRCLDILKSSRSKAFHTELYDTIPDQEKTAEEEIQQVQLVQQLASLLSALPSQQRMALSYYYHESLDVLEIAQRLDLSELAVRSLIKRGKEKLRQTSGERQTYFS